MVQLQDNRVRMAGTSDRRAFAEIDPRVTIDLHRRQVIDAAIAARHCWIAEHGGKQFGYGIATRSFFDHDFIDLIFVAEQSRRRGGGTAILRAIEQTCVADRIFTSTNESNIPMRTLLEKCGYRPSGRIENLDPGDPELIFVKFLPKKKN